MAAQAQAKSLLGNAHACRGERCLRVRYQYAPRPDSKAGIVWKRICRSNQIEWLRM